MFAQIETDKDLKAYLNKWAEKLHMTPLSDEEFVETAKFADYAAQMMDEKIGD